MVFNDDCLIAMNGIDDESIDLIYLDPPFFTQKKQKLSNSAGKEYEFSDVWSSRGEYLEYIKERLLEMRRILKKEGNVFFHCDTSASWYLKMVLDEVFGENNFRNEIIWSYKRWSNSQKGLIPNHQTIFWYSKTAQYKFNTLYGDYSPTTNIDQILQDRERNMQGKAVYKQDGNGNIVHGKEKKGVPLSDVWEIPFLNPKAKERTGYPTQKPIELLDRIITISTNDGDIVLDPFCGSGTTLVSAKLLGRKYIGIDKNPEAVELAKLRLDKPVKTNSILLKIGADAYKTKNEKDLAILGQFDCDVVQRNKGIDAFLKKHYLDKPVAIKIQRESESFEEVVKLLDSAGKKKNCSFTVLIARDKRNVMIPANMVILNRLDIELEQILKKRTTI